MGGRGRIYVLLGACVAFLAFAFVAIAFFTSQIVAEAEAHGQPVPTGVPLAWVLYVAMVALAIVSAREALR